MSIMVIVAEIPRVRLCGIAPGSAFVFLNQRFVVERRVRYVFMDRLVDMSQRLIGVQLDDGMPDWTSDPPAKPELSHGLRVPAVGSHVLLGRGGMRVWFEPRVRDDFESAEDRMIVLASYLSDEGVLAVQLPVWRDFEQEIARLLEGPGEVMGA